MTPDAELSLTLDIPQRVTVVSCKLTEGISKLTHAKLEVASTSHLVLDGTLERDALVSLAPEGFPPRTWTLRVGHIDFVSIEEGSFRYLINLYPAFWLLRFTTNTRKFRNMSAQAIISQVLGECQVAHRFDLVRPTETRKYCAQYRETNLDFIHRLLEFEGIYYYFEPDGTLVLADESPAVDPIDGISAFDLIEAEGAMQWDAVGIHAFRRGRRIRSGTATVNDHNWKTPAVSLLNGASAAEDAELDWYDYMVGFRKPEQGARLAQQRLEAHRVATKYVEASSNVTSMEPAKSFVFGPLAGARFAGEYVVTDVEHHYFNRKFTKTVEEAFDAEEINYRNHLSAIPKATRFRPPLVTPHPHIAGCHTAMVRGPQGEEIHTDQHGRFRAQFHWDREAKGTDEDSRWLRPVQETQTGMVLQRIGWEVSIAYVNGDPDRPLGFARNINGMMTPEYAQPANKTRMTIKTPTYPQNGGFNEIRLEDLAGQQHFDWHAQKDLIGQIENDRTETVGNNETTTIGNTLTRTIENDQTRSVGGDFKVNVGNSYTFTVEHDRKKTVTGNEEYTITEADSWSVGNNDVEEVTGTRKTKAGEEDSGSITRAVKEKLERHVKGAWSAEGQGNFVWLVQDELKETVKTTKTTKVSEGPIKILVNKDYTTEVQSSELRKVGKSMGGSAKNALIEVGGSFMLMSGNKIAFYSDDIKIEADASMTFAQGALSMKLTPGAIAVDGQMKVETKSLIHAGKPENLTK